MLYEMGINVVEIGGAGGRGGGKPPRRKRPKTAMAIWSRSASDVRRNPRSAEPADRTDDPVRMYLREMGSVELLSREGEIAIAKRIEAGREAMIAGLCESPLTFQAIIIWRDELERGKDLAARHHRSRGDLRRARCQGDARHGGRDGGRPGGTRHSVCSASADAGTRDRAERCYAFMPRRMTTRIAEATEPPIGEGEMDDDDLENSAVALGHGGRAQAQSAGNLRPRRRRL